MRRGEVFAQYNERDDGGPNQRADHYCEQQKNLLLPVPQEGGPTARLCRRLDT